MGEGRPYTALGEVINVVAQKRNVRGPFRIHNYMKARLGENVPGGVAISKWMYGDSDPEKENLQKFAEAFELSKDERIRLAWAAIYGEELPEGER